MIWGGACALWRRVFWGRPWFGHALVIGSVVSIILAEQKVVSAGALRVVEHGEFVAKLGPMTWRVREDVVVIYPSPNEHPLVTMVGIPNVNEVDVQSIRIHMPFWTYHALADVVRQPFVGDRSEIKIIGQVPNADVLKELGLHVSGRRGPAVHNAYQNTPELGALWWFWHGSYGDCLDGKKRPFDDDQRSLGDIYGLLRVAGLITGSSQESHRRVAENARIDRENNREYRQDYVSNFHVPKKLIPPVAFVLGCAATCLAGSWMVFLGLRNRDLGRRWRGLWYSGLGVVLAIIGGLGPILGWRLLSLWSRGLL